MGALVSQYSFAAGEVGPQLYGRKDQELYYIGLRTCLNMIVRQYGGASYRNGFEMIAPVRYPDKKTRVIAFEFSTVQTYALEFGDEYMRVVKDGGQVLETSQAITDATQANPCVVTCAGHGYSDGDDVFIVMPNGMKQLNGRWFRVANKTTDTFELTDYHGNNIDSLAYSAYTSGGTVARVYTMATPWGEDDLALLSWTQDANVMTVVHGDYDPRDIGRTSHTSWSVSVFANTEGPFKDINTTSTTVYASAASGTAITLTASASLFTAADVGKFFYIEQTGTDTTKVWEVGKSITTNEVRRAGPHYYKATNTKTTGTVKPDWIEGTYLDGDDGVSWTYLHSGFGIVQITAVGSATSATADVVKRLPDNVVGSGGATPNWAKAAWSDDEGYPTAVGYFSQRLLFGGNEGDPQVLYASGTNARTFFGKSNPLLDDETISIKLDTRQVNAIRQMVPLADLIVLTTASEQLVKGDNGALLATQTPTVKPQGENGSSSIRPIIVGDTALYVDDTNTVVRSLAYEFNTDSFTGVDLTVRSPHLFFGKQIVDAAFQKIPYRIAWYPRDDGVALGFTFLREQQVAAWHRHVTDGQFTSVCCPREGNETALYATVVRSINGRTEQFIERYRGAYVSDPVDSFHVDCGIVYDGRNTGSDTMTASGGTTWDETDTLTLTASASNTFDSSDVGNAIVFWVDDTAYRMTITAYTSDTVVNVTPNRELPLSYRNVAFTDWEFARKEFYAWHLIGKGVSVLGDGNVYGSYDDPITVDTDGKVIIQEPCAVVSYGLPYEGIIETLDLAVKGSVTTGKNYTIPRVFVQYENSRGGQVYEPRESWETKAVKYTTLDDRMVVDGYDRALPYRTNLREYSIAATSNKYGRIGVRQADPLALNIISITPEVVVA